MPTRIYFDTETVPFRPGLMAPPIVCVQWCVDDGAAFLMTGRGEFAHESGALSLPSEHTFSSLMRYWLGSGALLVGHNVAYDMAVFAAHDPELVPLIFRAYRENRVTDTMLRQKLSDIGRGRYRGFFNGPVWIPTQYNLGDVGGRHGFKVDKSDPWRRRYALLRDVPLVDWPYFEAVVPADADECKRMGVAPDSGATVRVRGEDAIRYALGDPLATRAAYVGQAERYAPELLVDEFFQARKFWALHLASVWGLRTSLRGVMSLEKGALENLERLRDILQNPADCPELERTIQAYNTGEGLGPRRHTWQRKHLAEECPRCKENPPLVKLDGVRDTKAAKARMRAVCAEAGIEPRMTKGGKGQPDICLDKDACESSGDPLLEAYAEFSGYKKVLSNDVEALKLGVHMPISTHFDLCDTGRVSSAKPNVMNPRRLAGVRECYTPRGYQG
jgi:hypothetical protein